MINRRMFLKRSAAGLALPLFLPEWSRAAPASGKLAYAAIGVGGMGWSDIRSIAGSEKVNVVAMCDIDANNLTKAAAQFGQARRYRDFREMLETEGNKIDGVNVTVPDHMHAPIAMTALLRGKHVYCQKPLTHEIYESRQLLKAARKANVTTQMGIQIHSHIAYRMAAQMLRDGAIGKVKEWHSWVGADGTYGAVKPSGTDPVPDSVDWDLWIGVAPWRPYKANTYHQFKWRGWQDYGLGSLGDFVCHIFDPVFMGIGVKKVLSVEADKQTVDKELWPHTCVVHYELEGTSLTAGKTIRATWYDGGKKPPRELALMPADRKLPGSGSLIIGEEGVMLLPHWAGPQLYPMEKFKGFSRPKLKPVDHYHQWVNACLGEGAADANFEYAVPLSEAAILGSIAVRLSGQKLMWDTEKMRFTNSDEANRYIRRTYRKGWQIKGLS